MFLPLIDPCRYKGAWGGRGSGKSHFFAELLIELCMMRRIRAVCIREVQQSLKQSVKLLLEDKIKKMDLGHLFRFMEDSIRCPHGGLIIFVGMQNHTADSIKSFENFDIWWFEEAQAMSAYSFGLIYPTMRTAGAEFWASWNPRSVKDPIEVFMRSEDAMTDPDIRAVKANWRDNPWFPADLLRDMRRDRRRDPDRYAHVWLGMYRKMSQARVFRNWRTEAFETPADARFMFGCDWGFSIDPTVLIRCFIIDRTLFFDQEVWKVGCEIDHTPALFAGNDNQMPPRWINPKGYAGIAGALRWPIRADSANPQTISYMRNHGFINMAPAVKGPGSVEEGVEFMKTFDIVVHPRCEHVIDELSTYSYEIDKKTEEVLPVLEDKKNHTIDSCRYALEPLRRKNPTPLFGVYGQTANYG